MKSCGKLLVITLAGGLAGCGGGGSGTHVDTGLADATALRDLTSAQAISACQSVRSAIQAQFTVDDNVRRACELYGSALSDTPAECRTQADSCVTQTNDGDNPLFPRDALDFSAALDCEGDSSSGFEGCAVTVGEYERCLDARIDQVNQLFSSFSCAHAASVEMSDAQDFVEQLAHPQTTSACERLQSECPQAGPFAAGAD